MDKIVEAILKLIPFSKLFEKMGFSKEISASISIIIAAMLLYSIVKAINYVGKKIKHHRLAIEDIKPQFDHLSITKAREFYIPTQYQNASPARQDEPGFTHNYVARNKLIPFFLKTAFNEKISSDRFYLILADSGMGKTTFMINLFFSYHSFSNRHSKYYMKLFRFSNPDTISQIKAIKSEEAKKTILLLDALDEDLGIISTNPKINDATAFQNRVDEIIEITKRFFQVIITCRTQYFPGQEDDPYELKVKRPDETGFYTLNKIYISPFNEKEVEQYLDKKFGNVPFIKQRRKRRARRIVRQSKKLVMRPMLLSYIDYLIEDEVANDTAHNIYETLVSKWLQREAEKRKGISNRAAFITNLKALSYKAAIAIYLNWRKEGRMYLTKEEAFTIANKYGIELRPDEITGQSLLTCDGAGNWKFAHKSILEFFLANEAYNNPKFLKDMNFKGMDMAKKFYEELEPRLVFVDQRTNVYSEVKIKKLPDFYSYLFPVTTPEYQQLTGRNTNTLNMDFCDCSFKNAIEFCNTLNLKYNYPPVYDENYNFLDPNGNIVKAISKVRGFRLPTKDEQNLMFHFIMENEENIVLYKNSKPLSIEIGKIALKSARIVFDAGRGKIQDSNLVKEWCYDENGISISPIHSVRFSSSLKMDDYKRYVNEPKASYITLKETKDYLHKFRIVFVP